jgi:DNA-binding transcriptional ArsR family regulator
VFPLICHGLFVKNVTTPSQSNILHYIQRFEYTGVMSTLMSYERSAQLLKAMAHPVRLEILDLLRQGETCVCHIERVLDKRQAYISQQLKVLREAELVEVRREGLQMYYRLAGDGVLPLLEALCGPGEGEAHQIVAGCPCPECAVITPAQIN